MNDFEAILVSLQLGLPVLLTHLILTIAIWLVTLVISFSPS